MSRKFYEKYWKISKVDLPPGILMNHSGRKTVAQILQDADVLEDAIMGVTGHKSVQGIHAYKEVNVIYAIELSRSSILGDSTNTTNTPVEFSFDDDKKFLIFNNCHFNNVTFKL
ncbi:unnamed protein product [Rhizophagus irregularis]|uniref:Tyr recombinase domain-containing protein n=1 Tax=Rhizophagus irregularis TaxID=588596 RepID=A0A2I1HGR8_9GLOM|nr:hypothetical protein RhiirA4_477985 [Rhizophagus irregularis]PKY58072.1 hypothetical protein RhiirA4_479660 [Rhizophagus irregularis]CAB4407950.1 unnamed protein product [Rhizophagus irregularis]CAB4408449.1 unnamed protein product [Rhizophagus irregularis]